MSAIRERVNKRFMGDCLWGDSPAPSLRKHPPMYPSPSGVGYGGTVASDNFPRKKRFFKKG